MPIKTFRDRTTAAVSLGLRVRTLPPGIQPLAKRILDMLDAAVRLTDLAAPPGNRFEALKGKRRGRHSIRVNDRWRICFRWQGEDAFDVELCDYQR